MQMYPMKRIAEPVEVAAALLSLIHPSTSFTTGATLPVEGGITDVAPELELTMP
jgi:NAD(P)-dependent dehydrogenase (short-subunit alcohol dehydrogenase family)